MKTESSASQKIDFKILKMMQLRSSPGEVLDRVARDGEVFVVERNGQPRACLVPVSFLLPDISPERIAAELGKLEDRQEIYKLTVNEQKELEITCAETAAGEKILLTIVLPHGYPDAAPRIYADKLPSNTPKRWPDGSLAIFGTTATWNPKAGNVIHTLNLARVWLKGFSKWHRTGKWPEGADAR